MSFLGLKSEVARDDDAGIDHPDGVSTRTADHLAIGRPPDRWLSRFLDRTSGTLATRDLRSRARRGCRLP